MSLTVPPSPPYPPPPFPPRPGRTEPLHIPTVLEPPRAACPDPAAHYRCRAVDTQDPAAWEGLLAEQFAAGYRLEQVVRGDGERALLVFGHRDG